MRHLEQHQMQIKRSDGPINPESFSFQTLIANNESFQQSIHCEGDNT